MRRPGQKTYSKNSGDARAGGLFCAWKGRFRASGRVALKRSVAVRRDAMRLMGEVEKIAGADYDHGRVPSSIF